MVFSRDSTVCACAGVRFWDRLFDFDVSGQPALHVTLLGFGFGGSGQARVPAARPARRKACATVF